MSGRKTIQINPDFFKMSKSKKREKRKKPQFNGTLKPNNIKRQLLQKIKDHQRQQEIKTPDETGVDKFKSDFKSSMGYLQKMISEKKRKRQKKRHRRHTVRYTNNPNVPTGDINIMTPTADSQSPIALLTQKPKWGCLKGGTLPTWRQYKKTLKRNEMKKEAGVKLNLPAISPPTLSALKRQEKLSKIKKNIKHAQKSIKPRRTELVTTNRTLKIFRLGKKNGCVGVLIKSGKTRKIIKDEVAVLKKKSIMEIKKYLRKHNLIKAGSGAPENVLRKMYEDSYLAGDIYNKNPENMIHNYIHNQ